MSAVPQTNSAATDLRPDRRSADAMVLLLNCAFVAVVFVIHPRRRGRDGVGFVSPREGPGVEQIASLALVAGWALQMSSLIGRERPTSRELPSRRRAAAALMASSTAVALIAQRSLAPGWRTSVKGTGSAPLATAGPYRWVRHPVYSAMLGVLLSNVVAQHARRAMVGFAVGVVALELQARVVEEPALRAAFASEYARYATRAGRFMPMIGRSR